ncbi:uncharacterized protein LACBIDRAFT_298488 [Laccaria bicolor S238N-H82]|uniref:Predicted protein n=1 Tax=Laccaria bicolor (strain S238N-H82 / ATCC MYA-4686) TaxID=486041 RepID=B0DCZ2_LACBS|nr:uncharacterized protein LACBIDRAFT_298488 [Laccaria bicolor S238N-H82]EDR07521.1 predicted protein [Laccaria bicolor S238N-H82]|eukprot:XP_001881913.1 predicted protein [Laccaria bicolor S238N-H82]
MLSIWWTEPPRSSVSRRRDKPSDLESLEREIMTLQIELESLRTKNTPSVSWIGGRGFERNRTRAFSHLAAMYAIVEKRTKALKVYQAGCGRTSSLLYHLTPLVMATYCSPVAPSLDFTCSLIL